MIEKTWDVLIVGGGPAGLTAAIYAARYRLKSLVLAKTPGGLAAEAHKVCNYPSEEEIGGFELMEKMKTHAQNSGAEIKIEKVVGIFKEGDLFKVSGQSGEKYSARTVILALGTKHRQLGFPSEKKYLGKGISYCFTCDGMFFKDKIVGVIGGSNSAVTAALYFSEICPQVYLIYRRSKLRAEPAWVEVLVKKENVQVIYETNVVDLFGKEKLEGVVLDKSYQGSERLALDGLFVEIGSEPDQELIKPLGVEIDKEGFVKVASDGKTNIDGIWAAGDMTTGSDGLRQIVTACAEGAIAAQSVFKYLQGGKKK